MAQIRIPKTMATQHPDNAGVHPFSGKAFVSTADEVEEAYYCYSKLSAQEFMWDWEGKHVDEAVIEKMVETHLKFFKKNQLGKELFLTYRVPNVWKEKGYRVARAFANIIAANDLAESLELHTPPVFEIILPMTTRAEELFFLKTKYAEIAKASEFVREVGPKSINVIPLVEETKLMFEVDRLLERYLELCRSRFFQSDAISHVRLFIARSDPALTAGMVPAVVSAKAALSKAREFEEKSGIQVYPILGAGCLPFRGGLNPDNIENFSKEYAGLRTVTIQSAFRADYPETKTKKAIAKLNDGLNSKAQVFDGQEMEQLKALDEYVSKEYVETASGISSMVNQVAHYVPARRERKLHIGLLAYSRSVGKKKLPRAITFTAALYSLGVPPEFIATGRALKHAEKERSLDTLLKAYSLMRSGMQAAARFLSVENLAKLAEKSKHFKKIAGDVQVAADYLDLELTPKTVEQEKHHALSKKMLAKLGKRQSIARDVEAAGKLRRSLG